MPQRRGGNVATHASRSFEDLTGVTTLLPFVFQMPWNEPLHGKGFFLDHKHTGNRHL